MSRSIEGELFTDIVLEVFKLSGLLVQEGDQLTREFGLSSARWKVLGALNFSDTPLTVPQIAGEMGQTRQGVQRLVNEMKAQGLLALKDNPHHQRAKLIVMTEQGREVYRQLEQQQMPWANRIAEGIDSEELRVASSVLQRLTARLEPRSPEP